MIAAINANATTSCWSHLTHVDSLIKLKTTDTNLVNLSFEHIQLCPQNPSYLTDDTYDKLTKYFPDSRFRLHADIKISGRNNKADLAYFNEDNIKNWKCIADFSNKINAPAYSLHAGLKSNINGDFNKLFDNYNRLSELFDCDVLIEGHYPEQGKWFIDNWDEYKLLLNSGIYYVLDLSHLAIVAHRYGIEYNLLTELLNSDKCLEVHISDNNKIHDSHKLITTELFWFDYIQYKNKDAIVFYEGNHSYQEIKDKNNDRNRRK